MLCVTAETDPLLVKHVLHSLITTAETLTLKA